MNTEQIFERLKELAKNFRAPGQYYGLSKGYIQAEEAAYSNAAGCLEVLIAEIESSALHYPSLVSVPGYVPMAELVNLRDEFAKLSWGPYENPCVRITKLIKRLSAAPQAIREGDKP